MSDPRIPYGHDGGKPGRPDGPPEDIRPEPATGAEIGAGAGSGSAADTYSATVLGSHWFQGPDSDAGPASEPAPDPVPAPSAAPVPAPDRIEGEILRFGPGVTAAVRNRHHANTTAALWAGSPPGQPAEPRRQPERRAGGLRRYALAAAVLLAVLLYLAWQRYGPALAVRDVTVRTAARGPECDGTSDIVATVRTNGRPGTLTYRWIRSDGTSSGTLHEKLAQGQGETRLRLLWTFRGRGEYRATAELRITEPSRHTAVTHITYRCP
ncbi:hypothetical protein [Streptomyces odonnellii]|uniref:hypothetical protein n=1 Tax=Streptomyces odonnellii TaxID=1417980 RepID=UPI00099D85EC|nr:hypothetical protein [Streptomyces odonnellii]